MRYDYVQAYINRGDVLLKLNRTEAALSVYRKALTFEPHNPDLHFNLGVISLEQGDPHQGLRHMNQALEFEPNHPESLLNTAIVIQEMGVEELKPLATNRLLKLRKLQPENERVYFNLGMLAMDDKKVKLPFFMVHQTKMY